MLTQYTFYKIYCSDNNIQGIYIGSTKNFKKRKSEHFYSSNTDNSIFYQTIRENGGWQNWIMEIIEVGSYEILKDVWLNESYLILEFGSLNTTLPLKLDKRLDQQKVKEFYLTRIKPKLSSPEPYIETPYELMTPNQKYRYDFKIQCDIYKEEERVRLLIPMEAGPDWVFEI